MTRLVYLRTGIVLDRKEGAFPRMVMPFRLFAGGPLGSGNQWIPWIHIRDEVKAIKFLIENERVSGPVNLTAPQPVRQKEFARIIGKTINRPAFMPAPAFALRMVLGSERAENLLLTGLRVIPEKLEKAGFQFEYSDPTRAISEILKN